MALEYTIYQNASTSQSALAYQDNNTSKLITKPRRISSQNAWDCAGIGCFYTLLHLVKMEIFVLEAMQSART